MAACRPLLGCADLAELSLGPLIGQGSTKSVYRALWRSREVALSTLADPRLRPDFLHGLEMLQALGPSDRVVQLVGFCRATGVIITELQPLGDASRVAREVYAEVLDYLHSSPVGHRVMCDTNDLQKTLQQFLVTSDQRLVLHRMHKKCRSPEPSARPSAKQVISEYARVIRDLEQSEPN
ncbi:protein O-mannose kinase-like [Pollicipes pollicipes]|uniref:protein O-mannose kinase-like n=1 Tax=Pollicipes pollicipes TaxID=41117 RepID=UPI001885523D|nr:protein O-mannose kinase-like [Pollicipes pollicipes]